MRKHLTAGRVACYLLLLTAACTLAFGATNSRFYAQVTGAGTANVAAAALNSDLDVSKNLEGMAPGETRTVALQVSNQEAGGTVSEVTQRYAITIETTGNLPLVYELSTSDPPADHALIRDGSSLVWTGGVLPHSTPTTHTYLLTVTWPAADGAAALRDEIDRVAVVVDAEQLVE